MVIAIARAQTSAASTDDADEAVLAFEEQQQQIDQLFSELPAAFTRRLEARRLDQSLASMPPVPEINSEQEQALLGLLAQTEATPSSGIQARTPSGSALSSAALRLQSLVVNQGGQIAVNVDAGPNPSPAAWIGFYSSLQNAATDYISYTFLNNLSQSRYDVSAPQTPGRYHFRLFLDEGYTPAAISDEVEVR